MCDLIEIFHEEIKIIYLKSAEYIDLLLYQMSHLAFNKSSLRMRLNGLSYRRFIVWNEWKIYCN